MSGRRTSLASVQPSRHSYEPHDVFLGRSEQHYNGTQWREVWDKVDFLEISDPAKREEYMHKIDVLEVGPTLSDPQRRKDLLDKVDFLHVGATLSDRDRRYALARKIDFLDVGTPLGKNKFMQKIDFLDILPKPGSIIAYDSKTGLSRQLDQRYYNELSILKGADEKQNLARFYEHVTKALSENGQDICKNMNTIITYEVETPCAKTARRNTVPSKQAH